MGMRMGRELLEVRMVENNVEQCPPKFPAAKLLLNAG